MEPIYINTDTELKDLADEMRIVAEFQRKDEPCGYSDTEEKAIETAQRPEMIKMVKQAPYLRLVVFEKREAYCFSFTLEKESDDENADMIYHLSMSRIDPKMPNPRVPQRVPDQDAERIVKAFFPDGCTDIGPQGGFTNIRHYTRKYECQKE